MLTFLILAISLCKGCYGTSLTLHNRTLNLETAKIQISKQPVSLHLSNEILPAQKQCCKQFDSNPIFNEIIYPFVPHHSTHEK